MIRDTQSVFFQQQAVIGWLLHTHPAFLKMQQTFLLHTKIFNIGHRSTPKFPPIRAKMHQNFCKKKGKLP